MCICMQLTTRKHISHRKEVFIACQNINFASNIINYKLFLTVKIEEVVSKSAIAVKTETTSVLCKKF